MLKKSLLIISFISVSAQASDIAVSPFLLVPARWENKSLIYVDKKIRKLFVFKVQQGKPLAIFETEADSGKSDGNKTKRNDQKTPEGIYFPQTHLASPAIPFNLYGNRAFTLDYPNYFDRAEGKTGSGIWIHSVPDNVPLTRGSRGCVVIRNKSIDELKSLITLKETPVLIESEDESDVPQDEVKTQITQFIDQWKQAWASKDLDKYMNFYSSSFKTQGYNFNSWKDYKSRVNQVAGAIDINLEEILALKAHNQYLVSFVQKYKSEKLQDTGMKTLWIKKDGDSFKIIREDWNPLGKNELIGLGETSEGH